jgi:hypothetical protein
MKTGQKKLRKKSTGTKEHIGRCRFGKNIKKGQSKCKKVIYKETEGGKGNGNVKLNG